VRRRAKVIGVVTKGSLVEGVEMKLAPDHSVEDVKAGKFVVIEGEKNEFFSMITDIRLDATSSDILVHPPDGDGLMKDVLKGTSTYATVSLRPMLMLRKGQRSSAELRPVKSVPVHFSRVREAEEEDVGRVFGSEEMGPKYFQIGTPLDMETPVCLNLERFIERSNGIFGKTGTGKTFLTRLVLSGLIRQGKAVTLVFDMHNEYGYSAMKESSEGARGFVKGLKQLFGNKVALFSLDPDSTRARGVNPDHEVYISYDQVQVEDIAILQDELRLNPTAIESAYLLYAIYRRQWLRHLLSKDGEEVKELAEQIGAHKESLAALHRKLKRFEHFPFMVHALRGGDAIDRIMEYIDRGVHIVLEFGRQTSMLAYLLVANIIARRIHEKYVEKSERYFATQRPEDEPRQLVLVLEEAHKFLSPMAAKQTAFGQIAREMRKYYVSLLVIDQRPSGIDEEVMSQIGTKIVALLNDERDIQAVLTGVSNSSGLRSVLASLDSKQQVLVLGHAVPMPVVVRTRDYDERFYREVTRTSVAEDLEREIEVLYGERG